MKRGISRRTATALGAVCLLLAGLPSCAGRTRTEPQPVRQGKDAAESARAAQPEVAVSAEEIRGHIEALAEPDKNTRRYAASFLGKWGKGDERTIPALVKCLDDPSPEVVYAAISSLDRLGDKTYRDRPQLVEALCARLESRDMEEGAAAAKALGLIGDPRAARRLIHVIVSPQVGEMTRSACREALKRINAPESSRLLLEVMKEGWRQYPTRVSAAKALQILADSQLNAAILPLTKSRDSQMRALAVKALGFEGNREVAPRLAEICSDTGEKVGVRREAVGALAVIGGRDAVPPLAAALSDEDVRLRREAARALGKVGLRDAVPHLIHALEDRDPYVAMASAYSLAHIGDRRAAPALLDMFDRPDALKGPLAASTAYTNPATAAHWALAELFGQDVQHRRMMPVSRPEKLEQMRRQWRKRIEGERKR